ncbi:class I SAM-dependent methyltransferase [Flavilitoribacter nigricans]|uniref:Methyltransferase domain-containing protein n=1 Tax=Flavilitoribacter nigricans (strain ATCC 23147 / DSM 23189 / NBRC 102662 / NCIMB 1420 / SS-2) TaxID=1122177 RepID=A0A2D0MZN0_FLAN2|nr:class I SAM-dependent methyltransferase [Flavilitoribacter nigricans]PHN01731.1 hypothetical protein CRP01_35895 [Flavilitoribacter nigricans DSM 23189 = NBRC 102662]
MSTPQKAINDLHRSDLYLHFYGDSLTEERTAAECEYITHHCRMAPSSHILDLACGHGRHANWLARHGHRVSGVDMNSQFIAIAREEARTAGLDIEYIEGDILNIGFEAIFDTVLLLFNTFGFFDKTDGRELFRRIGKALKPGGRAFIDTRNRDQVLNHLVPCEVTEKGTDLMIDRISFDPVAGTTTNRRIYLKDGVRYDAPFTMYSYHYGDLAGMVEGSGMQIETVLGGWKQEDFDTRSRRIILILRK